jgi:ribose 5-phosphate isomerase A
MDGINNKDAGKKLAAEKASEFIKPGMVVGLGTGTTVGFFLDKLSLLLKDGLEIKAISTSHNTTNRAESLGIPLYPISKINTIDITIDGADEIDPSGNGIKGGGGALLYEKIVAVHSLQNIWIADSSKLVDKLGKFPLPVEVVPFGYKKIFHHFKEKGYRPKVRLNKNNDIFITDGGHYIIDLHLDEINNPRHLQQEIKLITGVVDTGLFLGVLNKSIIGFPDGGVQLLEFKK